MHSIWNKINFDLEKLKNEFISGSTLKDLATQYNCSIATIKRKLQLISVDTSIYNNSRTAKERHRQKVCDKTKILSKDFLYQKYIQENLDTKTLSEQLGIHYSVIRQRIQAYKLKKSHNQLVGAWQARYKEKHGVLHPSQDPNHKHKYSKSLNKVRYKSKSDKNYIFKSIRELSYALYMDQSEIIWDYETERVNYIHHFTGKPGVYIIDFITEDTWIEVKPHNSMIPHDKRLYAERKASAEGKKFRGLLSHEVEESWKLVLSGYRSENYNFIHRKPRRDRKQITYYFKNKEEMEKFSLNGFKSHHRKEIAPHMYKLVLRKENADKP